MIAGHTDIWRQRLWVWTAALAFLLLNCVGLLIYQIGYANRVKVLRQDATAQSKQLADTRAERQSLEGLLRQARINRERILQLYADHFSTRRRRLTGITAEVQLLAKRAGLLPRAITYPEEQIQQYGLVKRSFIFSVQGTYADLRKFVNLLELSDSFLTLEDATLAEQPKRAVTTNRGFANAFGAPGGAFTPPAVAPMAPMAPRTPTLNPAAGPRITPFPAVATPQAAAGGAAGASTPLRMDLRISTLFATQEESRDALAPLPGANLQRGRAQTP
jgi:Tfp pilus assembly protein PilO